MACAEATQGPGGGGGVAGGGLGDEVNEERRVGPGKCLESEFYPENHRKPLKEIKQNDWLRFLFSK